MVTLSCFIVLATLFSQDVTNGPRHSSFKIMDFYLFYILYRLFLVFIMHIIHVYLERWFKRIEAKQEERKRERSQNTEDWTDIPSEVEGVKTLQEGEIHHRDNKRHKNKLQESHGSWMHEVAVMSCHSKEAMTLPQPLKRGNKRCPWCSFSLVHPKQWFINLFIKNRKWFRMLMLIFWLIMDLTFANMVRGTIFNYINKMDGKVEEYCDTNIN